MRFTELLEHKEAILANEVYHSRPADALIIKAIYSIYRNEFGKEYKKGCGTCYRDVFNILLDRYKSGNMTETTPYKLKTYASGRINKVISADGTMVITNANISSRDADGQLIVEKILKENPGLRERFSKLPDTVIESKHNTVIEPEPIKMESTIEQLMEVAEEVAEVVPGFTLGKKKGRKKKI